MNLHLITNLSSEQKLNVGWDLSYFWYNSIQPSFNVLKDIAVIIFIDCQWCTGMLHYTTKKITNFKNAYNCIQYKTCSYTKTTLSDSRFSTILALEPK